MREQAMKADRHPVAHYDVEPNGEDHVPQPDAVPPEADQREAQYQHRPEHEDGGEEELEPMQSDQLFGVFATSALRAARNQASPPYSSLFLACASAMTRPCAAR